MDISYTRSGCHLLPSVMEQQIQEFDPELFLEFDDKAELWKVKKYTKRPVKYQTILDGKLIQFIWFEKIKVTVKTLYFCDMNSNTILDMQEDNYYDRHLGTYGYAKAVMRDNDRYDEIQEMRHEEERAYRVKHIYKSKIVS